MEKEKIIDHYGNDSLPHLKTASECGAEFFVTSNEILLNKRKQLEKKYHLKIRTPGEMVK